MYSVDDQDRVVELTNAPQCDTGAPCPMLLVTDRTLHLAYYLANTPADWDGKTVREMSVNTDDEPVALVSFDLPCAHMFGPPNDEAFNGHPLYGRGLRPYGVFEVLGSSWIRSLERMNSVHRYHRPERFNKYHHYVFSFHDTTFECVAGGFTVSLRTGSVNGILRSVRSAI
jgi:hypothetical protein